MNKLSLAEQYFMANKISKITEFLYLSGVHCLNQEAIHSLGITCVVDATNYPEAQITHCPPDVELMLVKCEDSGEEMIHLYFEIVNEKIREHKFRKGKTLVHCHLGMSRSPALCLAYLVAVEQMTLHDAFLMLRAKRYVVRPNLGFWKQLIQFEKLEREDSMSTVNLVKTKHGELIPDVLLELRQSTDQSMVVRKLEDSESGADGTENGQTTEGGPKISLLKRHDSGLNLLKTRFSMLKSTMSAQSLKGRSASPVKPRQQKEKLVSKGTNSDGSPKSSSALGSKASSVDSIPE